MLLLLLVLVVERCVVVCGGARVLADLSRLLLVLVDNTWVLVLLKTGRCVHFRMVDEP